METYIQTHRLRLRRLGPADAETIFQYRSLPEVARYQNWDPASADEVRCFLESLPAAWSDTPGQWFQLGIELRETGALAGDCGILTCAAEPSQAEIGITLAPAFQHRGLALEALRALLGELLSRRGKHRVIGSVDPRNTASMKLLARAGMRQEAHFVESCWSRGEWCDDAIFGILAREMTSTLPPARPELG